MKCNFRMISPGRRAEQNYRRVTATRIIIYIFSVAFPLSRIHAGSFLFRSLFYVNVRLLEALATGADNCVTLQSMGVSTENTPFSRKAYFCNVR